MNYWSSFNALPTSELAHHPHHSTVDRHVPGCTLKCSCGLWNAQQINAKDKAAEDG